MLKKRIFISSVQKEFSKERIRLCNYIRQDALLGKFFEIFLFEELPAANTSAERAYISEVANSDIYLGILGEKYGFQDNQGLSPTEKEFDEATMLQKYRICFFKTISSQSKREPKQQLFAEKVERSVIRKSFENFETLRNATYSSLVHYLEENEMLRLLPFDAAYHPETSLDDIDETKIDLFVRVAKKTRNFPLDIGTPTTDVLTHLSLMNSNQKVKNAAILLFGKKPQSFFMSSEIKCAQFYGNEVTKPIPSYQVYHGDLFSLVKQALDFVASRIDARVGTREKSVQAPVDFELPLDAVREAIVNAVAHRDYTSNASVQVMLFKNRLEIWNPGHLPPGITIEQLSLVHESFPTNPLIANPLYLAGYAERLGTGTVDIISKCKNMGLKVPEFIQSNNFRTIFWRNEPNPISSEPNPISSEPNPISSEPNPISSKRMNKTQIEELILSICSGEYLTINQIAMLIGKTTNHITREILPSMLADGKLIRKYPETPKHPNQAYKANP